MRAARSAWETAQTTRKLYSTSHSPRPIPVLADASVETFRAHAFNPAKPFILPRKCFEGLPAVEKWFIHNINHSRSRKGGDGHQAQPRTRTALNREYFLPFGSTCVPLEMTQDGRFTRFDSVLAFFLECVQAASSKYVHKPGSYFSAYVPGARPVRRKEASYDFFSPKPMARVYLAQAPIMELPRALRDDVPTPEVVLRAGRGDVYNSSIWLGEAPTYTTLHRDPNPNLFVQLAGRKIVRLTTPEMGHAIFSKVQEQIGGVGSAHLRGEEMMQGAEREALEAAVWSEQSEYIDHMWEVRLHKGDALFIPKGWWHSVKGIGTGMNGSVNWWFR